MNNVYRINVFYTGEISVFTRFRLLFKRSNLYCDHDHNTDCFIEYKKLNGINYFIREVKNDRPKELQ